VIRTTNLLERLFREERRRTRAVSTFFGEKPVLKLMFAALIRAAERWNGIQINDIEREQLKRLQRRLVEQHRQDCAPVVELASKSLTAEEA
jgi:transposase-like protein